MKLTKKQAAAKHDLDLMTLAAANLAEGVDPIEVYKHAGKYAFDPCTEHIAEIYRRYKAAQRMRPSAEIITFPGRKLPRPAR